jgi:hypothetical protein
VSTSNYFFFGLRHVWGQYISNVFEFRALPVIKIVIIIIIIIMEKVYFLKFILVADKYWHLMSVGRMHLSFSGNERLSSRVLLVVPIITYNRTTSAKKKLHLPPIAPPSKNGQQQANNYFLTTFGAKGRRTKRGEKSRLFGWLIIVLSSEGLFFNVPEPNRSLCRHPLGRS